MHLDSKEIISLIVGITVFLAGILQLAGISFNYNWFTLILPYLLSILGFYLAVESIIELSNSNLVGWTSFIVGFLIMAVGIFNVMQRFGIASFVVIPSYVYHIIFILQGLFLIIAAFAMEP